MNVLIVEDSPTIAQRVAELVALPGVNVVKSCDTEDAALEACEVFGIDFAVIDLQLAQGTGFGVIRRLRATRRDRPTCIVVLTSHAVPALKSAAFEAGADYFLDKARLTSELPRLVGEIHNQLGRA